VASNYKRVEGGTVAFISVPGGRSLRSVNNRGGGIFVKGVDQNFSPFFHWAIYTLTKLSPQFLNYALNKTFS